MATKKSDEQKAAEEQAAAQAEQQAKLAPNHSDPDSSNYVIKDVQSDWEQPGTWQEQVHRDQA